jgi:hypothetical protein
VLLPLIKEQLHKLKQTEQEALGLMSDMMQPVRIQIGKLLSEAKPQFTYSGFGAWIKKVRLSRAAADEWMRMAAHKDAHTFKGVQDFRRATREGYKTNPTGTASWRNEVQERLDRFNTAAFTEHHMAIAKEEALERTLGLELISIGYKVLATKLHPDKGGSVDAMRRLNKVRDTLREAL